MKKYGFLFLSYLLLSASTLKADTKAFCNSAGVHEQRRQLKKNFEGGKLKEAASAFLAFKKECYLLP